MWGRETEEWPLQLCGQIPQSTNLQKEKSCVKLIMYNFLSIWAAFPRSLPEQILSQLTCSLWPVPTAHCISVQGPCGELALRCYQQALSSQLFWFAKCHFCTFESTGKIWGWYNLGLSVGFSALRRSAFCGVSCIGPRVGRSAWHL